MTASAVRANVDRETPYARRARYLTNENGFAFSWPAVPIHQFLAERDRAFDAGSPTGLIALDICTGLCTKYPATTPTLLCRYVKLCAGEQLRTAFAASGEIYYVMSGGGESRNGNDVIDWGSGDVFCFPGGGETSHRAGGTNCLLFAVTNEPLLAFERLRAPLPEQAVVETTHWPAAEIERRFQDRRQARGLVHRRGADHAGHAAALASQPRHPAHALLRHPRRRPASLHAHAGIQFRVKP